MRQRKMHTSFSTSLDREAGDRLLDAIWKNAPFETPSSILRIAVIFLLAVGLDIFAEKGVFDDDSGQALMNLVVRSLNSNAKTGHIFPELKAPNAQK